MNFLNETEETIFKMHKCTQHKITTKCLLLCWHLNELMYCFNYEKGQRKQCGHNQNERN